MPSPRHSVAQITNVRGNNEFTRQRGAPRHPRTSASTPSRAQRSLPATEPRAGARRRWISGSMNNEEKRLLASPAVERLNGALREYVHVLLRHGLLRQEPGGFEGSFRRSGVTDDGGDLSPPERSSISPAVHSVSAPSSPCPFLGSEEIEDGSVVVEVDDLTQPRELNHFPPAEKANSRSDSRAASRLLWDTPKQVSRTSISGGR